MTQELNGKIAFASGKTGDYDIWTFEMASGELKQITIGSFWNDKPKWSPDGQSIVFVSDRTGHQEIYKVPAAGGEAVQLTELNSWADSPSFSPDGSTIAFVSNEAGNNDIWIMDANGENRIQVTRYEGSDDYVEWTADGQGLLWSSDRGDGDADIWQFDLKTQEKTQLNADGGADFAPVASPDGEFIAFCSNRQHVANGDEPFADRDKDIWLMRTDGSWPVRLTENQGADFSPCWSPDGNYLLYTASDNRNECHLRVVDVSAVLAAYASGNQQLVDDAANGLRADKIEMDRADLQAEIGAQRTTSLLTSWMPDSWVKSCYPSGYFGLERNPHWVAARETAGVGTDSSPATTAAI